MKIFKVCDYKYNSLSHEQKRRRLVKAGVVALLSLMVLVGLYRNISTVFSQNPHDPAYYHELTVDGNSYDKNARSMIDVNDFLFTTDTYHSPGMSILTSWVYRVYPSPLAYKIFNLIMWIFSLFIFIKILTPYFASKLIRLGLLAVLANVNILQKYCAMLQYEILVGTIIILLYFTLIDEYCCSKNKNLFFVVQSFLVACLVIVRFHFVLLFPILLFGNKIFLRKFFTLRQAVLTVFIFLLLLGSIFFIYYMRSDEVIDSMNIGEQAVRWLSENSAGYDYPYPVASDVSGIHYVLSNPLGYINLQANKILYLFGIKFDIWYIEPTFAKILLKTGVITTDEVYDKLLMFIGVLDLVLFVFGVVFVIAKREIKLMYSLLFMTPFFLPHLLVGASTRFFVPILMLMFVVQLYPFYLYSLKYKKKRSSNMLV